MKVVGENALERLINLIKAKFDSLAKVATSGSYTDLSNKPTIPSVGNGKITIKQGGITKGTFTVNQSGATGIELDDNDTHYTSKNVVGSSANDTNNTTTALTNGNVFLNSVENGSVTSSHNIKGIGGTNVMTDESGNIVIKGTTGTSYSTGTEDTAGITKLYSGLGTNTDGTMTQLAIGDALNGKAGAAHTHDAATTSKNGFMTKEDKAKLDGIQDSATAVSFAQSAKSGNKVGSITINGTSTDMYSPTQTNVSGNAGTATKWKTARKINGMTVDGTADRTNYGTCSTAADTAAKTVDCTGFELVTGAEITVKFTVTNNATKPTLNVNGKGARPIFYRGSPIATGYLAAGRVYTFRYDGAHYELVGDVNTDSDTKVSQEVTTVNAECPLLLGPNGQTTNVTTTAYFDSGVTLNPSTNTIAANISGSAAKVAKALTVKANGTQLYTYDGSVAKTINIKAGSNITITSDSSGNITISSTASAGSVTGDVGTVVYEATAYNTGLRCDGSTTNNTNNSVTIQDGNWSYKRFRFYCKGYFGLVCTDMPLDRQCDSYITDNERGKRYGGVIFPTAENGNINNTGIGPSNHMYYEIKWRVEKVAVGWTVRVVDSGWLGFNAGITSNADYTNNAGTSNAGTGYISWNQRHNYSYGIYKIVAYTD